jgi:hypothetical protein
MRGFPYLLDSVLAIRNTPTIRSLDIFTDYQGTVIPKPHDLGFCFIATASTLKEFYGLMFAPQTNPASPAVFMCRKPKKEFLFATLDFRDVFHCPVLFSRSTDFSSPLREIANFGVRVYVSIVAGGSLTTQIIPNIKPSSASLKDGVSNPIF